MSNCLVQTEKQLRKSPLLLYRVSQMNVSLPSQAAPVYLWALGSTIMPKILGFSLFWQARIQVSSRSTDSSGDCVGTSQWLPSNLEEPMGLTPAGNFPTERGISLCGKQDLAMFCVHYIPTIMGDPTPCHHGSRTNHDGLGHVIMGAR